MKSKFNLNDITIIKKNGTREKFEPEKIIAATQKSANRIAHAWTENEKDGIIKLVIMKINESGEKEFSIETIHSFVEYALDTVNPKVAGQYRSYRNFKQRYLKIFEKMEEEEARIRYLGDRSNANKDGKLVATKKSLILGEYETKKYEEFFITDEEREAAEEGYIYIHDKDSRLDTFNCCLFDAKTVFKNGFVMGQLPYTEPKSLIVAFHLLGDVILATAAQQYGGFTVPEVDTFLEPYAKLSYEKHYADRISMYLSDHGMNKENADADTLEKASSIAHDYAYAKVEEECTQGYQGIECKLNTVGSSRGDYPFTTFTFGLTTSELGKLITKTILRVHKKGQGNPGYERPVLFPKLVFLYDDTIHGKGMSCEDIFHEAVLCSSKTMYPDYLSLTGEGYVASIYKKYKKVISPMGCRAFLSPWYERGGENPADEKDEPVFIGRCNLGVVTLHLPMIFMKAKHEGKDFYEVLDYYLEMIRNLHKRTIDYLGDLTAGCNPVMFCEGGIYGGHLQPNEKIEPLLKPMTISFGITALNELQQAYNQKSIKEDGTFAKEVMEYINKKINEYKKEDHILYAVYGTPAETLCGKQIAQFRKKYGIINGVSDREYTTNSFHDPVWENVTQIEKQDDENRFWNLFNGGKIQYCRYPVTYNIGAIKTLVRRAMSMGLYEGVNLSLSYCNHCGHQELNMKICPHCGSRNITSIDRMNGYLGYSRVGTPDGEYDYDSSPEATGRFNKAKTIELAERISM